jgi:hypothetical protein
MGGNQGQHCTPHLVKNRPKYVSSAGYKLYRKSDVLTTSRDAGVALVTYLSEVLSRTGEPSGSLGALDKLLQGNRHLNVLELGSG